MKSSIFYSFCSFRFCSFRFCFAPFVSVPFISFFLLSVPFLSVFLLSVLFFLFCSIPFLLLYVPFLSVPVPFCSIPYSLHFFLFSRDKTGKFPEYPSEEEGGSSLLFKEKTPEEARLDCFILLIVLDL